MSKFNKQQAEEVLEHLSKLYDAFDFKAQRADTAGFMRQYLNDIEATGATPAMVRQACDRWRKDETKKRFPLIGEFLKLLEPMVESAGRVKETAWTEPCSAEEFDGMTLREKARECRLRSIFYGDKAGGMDIKGNLIRPEAFARYHPEETYWKAQAERFEGLVRQAKHTERPSHGLNTLAMAAPIARLG